MCMVCFLWFHSVSEWNVINKYMQLRVRRDQFSNRSIKLHLKMRWHVACKSFEFRCEVFSLVTQQQNQRWCKAVRTKLILSMTFKNTVRQSEEFWWVKLQFVIADLKWIGASVQLPRVHPRNVCSIRPIHTHTPPPIRCAQPRHRHISKRSSVWKSHSTKHLYACAPVYSNMIAFQQTMSRGLVLEISCFSVKPSVGTPHFTACVREFKGYAHRRSPNKIYTYK